jgi:hypothetical protein
MAVWESVHGAAAAQSRLPDDWQGGPETRHAGIG